MIRLEKLNAENWTKCLDLKEDDNARKFIASNLFSIAQAQFYPKAISRAIYMDDSIVGYVMYGEDEDNPSDFHIDRLMIGKDFQGKGYAKQTLSLIISEGIQKGYKSFSASVHPENEKMQGLLACFAFRYDGEMDGEERVYKRTCK